MPKGSFPKLKGSICNIPVDRAIITNTLPHAADSSELVMVKLKRKLSFRRHVYFEPVCPKSLYQALLYLKENNPIYHDTSTNMNNIPNELTDLTELDSSPETENLLVENDNPLYSYQCNSQESILIPNTPRIEEISIAPGEGKQPYSLLTDKNCGPLAFPYFFPAGKFVYRVE